MMCCEQSVSPWSVPFPLQYAVFLTRTLMKWKFGVLMLPAFPFCLCISLPSSMKNITGMFMEIEYSLDCFWNRHFISAVLIQNSGRALHLLVSFQLPVIIVEIFYLLGQIDDQVFTESVMHGIFPWFPSIINCLRIQQSLKFDFCIILFF